MAVDHERELPVPAERLDFLAGRYGDGDDIPTFKELTPKEQREILTIALAEAQLEEQRNLSFFLGEAYDIYNARFR